MIIKNGLVFRGKRGFIEDTLYIQDGRFTETADGEIIDAAGCYVIPGLVDIHFHGAAGYDLCDASAQAIALGADHLTHTCNAMALLSHRAPGPIAAGYMADSVMAEVICDGIHVHPAMVKGLLRLFGEDRVVFISDSMRAAGNPARSIGIQRQVGSLDIGKYADCVLLDRDTLEIRRVLS